MRIVASRGSMDLGASQGGLPPDSVVEQLDAILADTERAARLQDADGFRAACVQGLELGFDGKTLIYPSQVEPCNEVFAPSPAEVDTARRIIIAFREAEAAGKGVVVVDGKLVENLHVVGAERMVALADAIAARGA